MEPSKIRTWGDRKVQRRWVQTLDPVTLRPTGLPGLRTGVVGGVGWGGLGGR